MTQNDTTLLDVLDGLDFLIQSCEVSDDPNVRAATATLDTAFTRIAQTAPVAPAPSASPVAPAAKPFSLPVTPTVKAQLDVICKNLASTLPKLEQARADATRLSAFQHAPQAVQSMAQMESLISAFVLKFSGTKPVITPMQPTYNSAGSVRYAVGMVHNTIMEQQPPTWPVGNQALAALQQQVTALYKSVVNNLGGVAQ